MWRTSRGRSRAAISLYLPRCYYPQLTRDEAVLIKCWDSYGRDFAPHHATPRSATVPATFALHSGFEDPAPSLTLILTLTLTLILTLTLPLTLTRRAAGRRL